jgi:CheY-like chemotaxis protein
MTTGTYRGRVLVVDDDRRLAESVCELLERYRYYARVASGPVEAARHLAVDRFDVLIVDWILSGGNNGRTVVEQARDLYPDLPVVVYSAFPSSDAETATLPNTQFVPKGPDVDTIRNAVERALTSLHSPTVPPSQGAAAFVETLLGGQRPNPEAPLGLVSPGRLPRPLLDWACRLHGDPLARARVIRAAAGDEADGFRNRLCGRVRFRGGQPDLDRGLLDGPGGSVLVVRNAGRLPDDAQRLLSRVVADQSYRRVGADLDIATPIRLILTVEGKPPGRLSPHLGDLVGDNWVTVPTAEEVAGGIGRFINTVLRTATDGHLRLTDGAVRVIDLLPPNCYDLNDWERTVVRLVNQHPAGGDVYVNDLNIPLLDPPRTGRHGGAGIPKWRQMKDVTQSAYMIQALIVTGGNIQRASQLTGLGRNVFYDRLAKLNLDRRCFKRPRPPAG